MFKKFFNKENSAKENQLNKPLIPPFQMLVIEHLRYNGVDSNGVLTEKKQFITDEDISWMNLLLKESGLFDGALLKELIMDEWSQMKEKDIHLIPSNFSEIFVKNYHNHKLEKFVDLDIQERNKNLKEAYNNIIITVDRTQGFLEDNKLRTRIETNFRDSGITKRVILQCTTPFCIISLGCDEMGQISIVYSLDQQIREMISDLFANTLIRRIYQFTPGSMEPFVKFNSLYHTCYNTFENLLISSKSEPYHKIITKYQNS